VKLSLTGKSPLRESEQNTSETVQRFAANLGERFGDYLIIVRSDKGLSWRSSDRTWAIGACDRYVDSVLSDDRVEREEQKDG
jgi:hypothetical protein